MSFHSATPIERWSLLNAVGMLGGTGAAIWAESVWLLLGVGGALLAGLLWVARGRWTRTDRFGGANTITVLRVVLLGGLPPAAAMGGWGAVAVGVVFLLADGLDGWWARRRGLMSEFGAFFDKEADALFLLVLCALSAFEGHLPVWIVGIGLLRYGFVVLLFLVQSPTKTEARFSFARYAYGAMVSALLCSFLPYPRLYEPFVALAAGALLLSFAWSTVQVVIKAGQVRHT